MNLKDTDNRTKYKFIDFAYQTALLYQERYQILASVVDGIIHELDWPKEYVTYRAHTWNNPLLGPKFEIDRREGSSTYLHAYASISFYLGERPTKQEVVVDFELIKQEPRWQIFIRCERKEQAFEFAEVHPEFIQEACSFIFGRILERIDTVALQGAYPRECKSTTSLRE